VDTLTYVEVVRDVIGPVGDVSTDVDAVDLALLRALQDDGRASYVDLAEVVGLIGCRSPSARRPSGRIAGRPRWRSRAALRARSAKRNGSRHPPRRRPPRVVDELKSMSSVIFVARTLGRSTWLVTVRAFSAAQLVELLDTVRALQRQRDRQLAHFRSSRRVTRQDSATRRCDIVIDMAAQEVRSSQLVLTDEFKDALALLGGGRHVFLTGKAGTGKSTLIRRFILRDRPQRRRRGPTASPH